MSADAQGSETPEITLVGHIETLLESVQEARDYLIASDTPTTGYPTKSVEAVSAWLTRLDHQAIDAVIQELAFQQAVWGHDHDRDHSDFDWAAILTKYVGRFVDQADHSPGTRPQSDPGDTLIKIAAVALSAWIARRAWGT